MRPATFSRTVLIAALAALGACASQPPEIVGPPAKEEIVAVSSSNHLMRFNAGQPQNVRDRRPLQGLRAGERLLGIDYRVAKGELFALGVVGTSAQLYKIDVAQARAAAIGVTTTLPMESSISDWGIDFNPTVDRIRLVNSAGLNMRLHPDTGAHVDGDANQPGVQPDSRLTYDPSDVPAGKASGIVAAGYTYNKDNDKITTNYALDGISGMLVHQGTKEGVTPAISPNSGRLYTVGSLGIGPFAQASLDISDVSNAAYSGVQAAGAKATRWYRIDLATGKASFIGTVGGGETLVGAAIEP